MARLLNEYFLDDLTHLIAQASKIEPKIVVVDHFIFTLANDGIVTISQSVIAASTITDIVDLNDSIGLLTNSGQVLVCNMKKGVKILDTPPDIVKLAGFDKPGEIMLLTANGEVYNDTGHKINSDSIVQLDYFTWLVPAALSNKGVVHFGTDLTAFNNTTTPKITKLVSFCYIETITGEYISLRLKAGYWSYRKVPKKVIQDVNIAVLYSDGSLELRGSIDKRSGQRVKYSIILPLKVSYVSLYDGKVYGVTVDGRIFSVAYNEPPLIYPRVNLKPLK